MLIDEEQNVFIPVGNEVLKQNSQKTVNLKSEERDSKANILGRRKEELPRIEDDKKDVSEIAVNNKEVEN